MTPDTITTGDGRTIPPPTEADMTRDLSKMYAYYLTPLGSPYATSDWEAILTRRAYHAEAEVRRQAEENARRCYKCGLGPVGDKCRACDAFSRCVAAELEIVSLRERVARHGTTSIRPVFPIQPEDMP